jgi:3alpha(or 20beta)-hydroxysteroid dehydrogenase
VSGRFYGCVVLISGAARGQGAAEAEAFAAEGAHVLLGDVLDDEGGAAAASIGAAASYVHLDVTSEESWQQAVARLERLDVLVNNAGVASFATVEEVELADFRRVMDINVIGTLLGIKTCAPLLRRSENSSIVNISSISGMKGQAESPAYVTSKWAVRGLTKAAAVDLAPHGIRVNSVHPGVIETPMVMRPGKSREEILERHLPKLLLPRLGTPEDVVPLVLFLASRDAAYVTGAEFVVDGGWTVR